MDPETREFLEEQFGRIQGEFGRIQGEFGRIQGEFGRIQGEFGRIDERLEGFDHRFERVDQQFTELREDIDRRFGKVDRRFEKVDRRFEKVEEETRHTRILVEGLKSDLQAVAEGFATLDAKLGRTEAAARAEVEEDRNRNAQLHGRHEQRITDLDRRVDLLESAGG